MAAPPASPPPLRESYDAVVIGGGPAGTTFARGLAAEQRAVLVVERARHPRFTIGESLLPCTLPLWRRLGLLERFEKAGFLRKHGAYFSFADGCAPEFFRFGEAGGVPAHAYEVPRASFDQILWDAALEAGVHGVQETAVSRVLFDGERATGVMLRRADGSLCTVRARLVADCSGRATLLARQRELRERDPRLDTVALYRHYEGAFRSSGDDEGTIAIIATDFGWMWLIPFAGSAASVGAVLRNDAYMKMRRSGRGREEVWGEILAGVPAIATRLTRAVPTRPVELTADFQYRARRLAGDGWVLVGDAGAFLDPVFSSGVHLAMSGAALAARDACAALRRTDAPCERDFRRYVRRSRAALGIFSRFIYAWYDPAFRQVFLKPPARRPGVSLLKREIIGVLAGDVFRPWRRRAAIEVLLLLARLERRRGSPP